MYLLQYETEDSNDETELIFNTLIEAIEYIEKNLDGMQKYFSLHNEDGELIADCFDTLAKLHSLNNTEEE